MITICCVLKSGGCYTPEYVKRLKAGVDANLKGHRFVCLTDMDVECESLPLANRWDGWWSKIEIFKLTGNATYFDLDTIITGDLTEIVNYPHKFTMLRDFMVPDRKASGMMSWGGDHSYLYDNFDISMADKYKGQPLYGDGGYIQEFTDAEMYQDIFPDQVMSRKMHPNREKARVVCYHGQPRPHQTGWAT